MRVMAQMGMVMNLDKCIGCHTCSVTCKQAWTNRAGVEYVWFNNVETRPGPGLPAALRGPGTRGAAAGSSTAEVGCGSRPVAGSRSCSASSPAPSSRSSPTTTSPGPTTTRPSSKPRSATTSRSPGRSR